MSRRAARVKLCPTPSKARHATEDEAAAAGVEREEQAALIVGAPKLELYVYRCACTAYHLTHHRFGRDGARNRKAST